jgi:hypothetical protein
MNDTGLFAWLFKHSFMVPAMQVAPPVTVVAMTLFGHQLQDWVFMSTFIYTMFMTYKTFKEIRKI